MKTLFWLLVIVAVVYCIKTDRIPMKGIEFPSFSSASSGQDARENIRLEIQMKKQLLGQMKQTIKDLKENAPLCGGKKMRVTIDPEMYAEIRKLETEIRELNIKLMKTPVKKK